MPTLQVQPDFAFDATTDASDVASARIGACGPAHPLCAAWQGRDQETGAAPPT
jgi:hypothetical protein